MEAPTDSQLLDAARTGDRQALESLLIRHQPRIWRFALKMCRDEEEAKEILQETLLAAARTVKEFRGEASLSTWLFTIARSFCLKRRRRSKFAPHEETSLDEVMPGGEQLQLVDPARPPDAAFTGRELEAALEEAIHRLDAGYREVLVLRDVEGLSAPEVAEVMGLSVDAVKSRLHRARLAVREAVAPGLGLEEVAPPRQVEACPDIVQLLSRHLEGEISSSLCAEMEQHLSGCPSCTGRCESLRRTLVACQATPLPAVPEPVQAEVRVALRRLVALHT